MQTTTTTYRPRRQSTRWLDGDCPPDVLAIYDDPRYIDRFTVFYRDVITGPHGEPWIGYRGMSEHPTHPQGVGMGGEMEAHQVRDYRYRESHRACRWSDLPDAVKAVVHRDCEAV